MFTTRRFVQRNDRVVPDTEHPVEVQVMGPGFLDILYARDVSEGGLGLFVSHGFRGCDLEGEVELVVTLPSRKCFGARGIIRHRTEHEDERFFGLEFTQLSEHNRLALREFVDVRLEEIENPPAPAVSRSELRQRGLGE